MLDFGDETKLDTAGASDFTGVKLETLETWRSLRRGPDFIRVGRSVRYRLGDLRKWLESRTVKCGGGAK